MWDLLVSGTHWSVTPKQGRCSGQPYLASSKITDDEGDTNVFPSSSRVDWWWRPHRRWPRRQRDRAGQPPCPCSVSLSCGVLWLTGPNSQPQWVNGPGALSCWARFEKMIFSWIIFIDFNANFKNLYLELGVSNLGEPNFVGFILKCSIR